MIDRCSVDPATAEIGTRHIHEPDAEDFDDLTFSPADDEKLIVAAQWGRSLILEARAGSQQALAELKEKMHVTEWRAMR